MKCTIGYWSFMTASEKFILLEMELWYCTCDSIILCSYTVFYISSYLVAFMAPQQVNSIHHGERVYSYNVQYVYIFRTGTQNAVSWCRYCSSRQGTNGCIVQSVFFISIDYIYGRNQPSTRRLCVNEAQRRRPYHPQKLMVSQSN